jgi:hypothetical protein
VLAIASWPVAVPKIASDIGACSESAIALVDKPPVAGDGLDPATLGVGGLLGAEVQLGLLGVSEHVGREFDQ